MFKVKDIENHGSIWRSTAYPLATLKDVMLEFTPNFDDVVIQRSFLRLILKHKRIIGNGEMEEIHIGRFLLKQQKVGFPNGDPTSVPVFNPPNKTYLQDIKDDLIFSGVVEDIPAGTTKTIYASNSILIVQVNITGAGTLRIMTGTPSDNNPNYPNVFIYPNVILPNNVEFVVGVPELLQEKLLPVEDSRKSTPITSFCNNSIYINRAKNFAAVKDEGIVATTATQEDKFDGSSLTIAPNPTTTHTTLHYTVGTVGQVKLVVTNSLGVVVQDVLEVAHQEKGRFEAQLKTEELAAGLYFCSLQTAEGVITQKLLVTK